MLTSSCPSNRYLCCGFFIVSPFVASFQKKRKYSTSSSDYCCLLDNNNNIGNTNNNVIIDTDINNTNINANANANVDTNIDTNTNINVDTDINAWINAVWWSLKLDFTHKYYSKELKELLFLEDPKLESKFGTETELEECNNNNDNNNDDDGDFDVDTTKIIVQGIPRRPYYKELAIRLHQWNRRCYYGNGDSSPIPASSTSPSSSTNNIDTNSNTNHNNNSLIVVVPAESLGFQEIKTHNTVTEKEEDEDELLATTTIPNRRLSLLLPPKSTKDIRHWLYHNNCNNYNNGSLGIIYQLLGIRDTVGSISPLHKRLQFLPSREVLFSTTQVIHETTMKKKKKKKIQTWKKKIENENEKRQQSNNNKNHTTTTTTIEKKKDVALLLTVGARQRSKHTHRAIHDISFFGIAKGSASKQNKETSIILQQLLNECVWINSHNFGGLSSDSDNHKTNTNTNTTNCSWVLEIRQKAGYGARWLLQEELIQIPPSSATTVTTPPSSSLSSLSSSSSSIIMTKKKDGRVVTVQFRGFLEPQVENGHENRWRH